MTAFRTVLGPQLSKSLQADYNVGIIWYKGIRVAERKQGQTEMEVKSEPAKQLGIDQNAIEMALKSSDVP